MTKGPSGSIAAMPGMPSAVIACVTRYLAIAPTPRIVSLSTSAAIVAPGISATARLPAAATLVKRSIIAFRFSGSASGVPPLVQATKTARSTAAPFCSLGSSCSTRLRSTSPPRL